MVLLRVGLLALTVGLSACFVESECGLLAGDPALIVKVTDAATGGRLADSVTVVAREGTYVDTLVLVPQDLDPRGPYFAGPADRPGTYTVTVTRPGYRPGSVVSTVAGFTCGGDTYVELAQLLEVALEPNSP